jgi:hypothetical protein
MTWVRVEEGIGRNRKFRRAGLEALGLFVAGLGYSNEHLTDGFIPKEDLCLLLPGTSPKALQRSVDRLTSNQDPDKPDSRPSWLVVDGGWQIHDVHHYQPSKTEILAGRERERIRKAAQRAGRPAGTHTGTQGGTGTGTFGGQAEGLRQASQQVSGDPVRPVRPVRPAGASHTEGAREPTDDAWIAQAAARILGAYPPSHTGGEYDAKRAVFEAIRLGLIVADGAEPGKGADVESVCSSISGWWKSDPWKRGAIPKLRNFLERGVFLTPPPPPGSESSRDDGRRTAGANDTPQASRVQRIVV